MPELPEVETVKEVLKTQILKRKIVNVTINYPNIIEYPTVQQFVQQIKNQTIIDLNRRGKWLMFELNDYYLLSHLRMEGKFNLKDRQDEINKHEHVIFEFDDGRQLRYQDTRKFGKMHLILKNEVNDRKPLNELGLEPFDDNLTVKYLEEKFQRRKNLPIKSVLLDQKVIVGIGNIYANEILFSCKISPFKKANLLNSSELQSIIDNTKKILNQAIIDGGTTIRSYTSSEGVHGRFQQNLLVHMKDNQPCPNCGSLIVKEKINGRGTYFCPDCQK